jgi:hypothetical protein
MGNEFGNVNISRSWTASKVLYNSAVRELCAPVRNVVQLLVLQELEDLARAFRKDDGTPRAMTLTIVD